MPTFRSRLLSLACGVFVLATVTGIAPAGAFWFYLECPPPGYDGNSDCGYECGEGGVCCGNPHYYGSYVFGTWYPDPRCNASPTQSMIPPPQPPGPR